MAPQQPQIINQTTAPIPPCGSCRQSIAEYEIRQETPIEITYEVELFIVSSESLKI
jgi:cytidine deaminase